MSGFPGTIFGTGTTTVTGTQVAQTGRTGGGGASSGGGSSFGSGFLKVLGTLASPQMIAAYRNAIVGGGPAVITGAGGEQIHVVGTPGGKIYQVGTPNMQAAPGVDPSAVVSGSDNTSTLILLGLVAAGAYYFAKRRR